MARHREPNRKGGTQNYGAMSIREGKGNSHGGSVSAHPGETDRMVGGTQHSEGGVHSPKYLPGKKRR
jgi:hypothetical protein